MLHGVCLVGLHILEPGVSPVRGLLSDYAVTDSAWLATLAFLVFASIWASLVVALSAVGPRTTLLVCGQALFALAALAIVVTAFVPESADPRTGSTLAAVQNLLSRPGLFLGVLLVSLGLRGEGGWTTTVRTLVVLAVTAVGLLVATITVLLEAGWGGLAQRALFLLLYGWTLLLVHTVRRRSAR